MSETDKQEAERHVRRTLHLSSMVAEASKEFRKADREEDDAFNHYRAMQQEREDAHERLREATKALVEHCSPEEIADATPVPVVPTENPPDGTAMYIVAEGSGAGFLAENAQRNPGKLLLHLTCDTHYEGIGYEEGETIAVNVEHLSVEPPPGPPEWVNNRGPAPEEDV